MAFFNRNSVGQSGGTGGGEANTTSNSGGGDVELALPKSGDNLPIRTVSGVGDTRASEVGDVAQVGSLNSYSGWITAPTLTVNGGDNTAFDISSGVGWILDLTDPTAATDTIFILINFAGVTAVPGTLLGGVPQQTNIAIDTASTVLQASDRFVDDDAETALIVGNLNHDPTNSFFNAAATVPYVNYSSSRTFRTFMLALGGLNLSGCIFNEAGTDLQVQHSAGSGLGFGRDIGNSLAFPDTPDTVLQNPVPIIIRAYVNTTGDLVGAPSVGPAIIDPDNYNNAGVLTAVGTNDFTIQRIFFFYGSNTTFFYYGGDTYNSISLAEQAITTETFNEHPNTLEAAFRGWLIVREGTTNLSTTADRLFKSAGLGRALAGGQGTGGVVSLQQAYDNSTPDPEILTNDVQGEIQYRRGTTGGDTDVVFEVQNGAGTAVFQVTGEGVVGGGLAGNDFIGFRHAISSGSMRTIGTAGQVSSVPDSTNSFLISITGTGTYTAGATGIGGVDTSVTTVDTWYYVYAIADTTGSNATDYIYSLSITGPALPVGYDVFRYILPERTTAANLFRPIIYSEFGSRIDGEYHESGAFVQLLGAGTATALTVLDTSPFCPERTTDYLFDGGLDSASVLQGLLVGPNESPQPDNLTRYLRPAVNTGSTFFVQASTKVNSVREIVYRTESASAPVFIISRGFIADRGL